MRSVLLMRRVLLMRGVLLALVLSGLVAGCSPEAARTAGGGLGGDVGNSGLPIQMHGNQARNNPSAETPDIGRVPKDAKGVEGWWSGR
jgi:hypothetical protein